MDSCSSCDGFGKYRRYDQGRSDFYGFRRGDGVFPENSVQCIDANWLGSFSKSSFGRGDVMKDSAIFTLKSDYKDTLHMSNVLHKQQVL